ncbi:MAG: arsenate reductase ArsC [Candidatus Obscuribacterales bacterium]|nr:arsenate reductase ArsC [Cyanobacteria bacterium HKST-UBA01]MCB9470396.1 arsenate reductase ArsC [Candidatus Obscuribacterales bacterium]
MKFLFICVENTCRSQMAEGLARNMGHEAHSCGLRKGAGIDPLAIQALAEVGIDGAGQYSKALEEVESTPGLDYFDRVISLCSADAKAICPSAMVEAGRAQHWPVEDPKGQSFTAYRRARDEIKAQLDDFLKGQEGKEQ